MSEEIWKAIEEYPEYLNLYSVSNKGRVMSLKRPSNITTGNSHTPTKGFRSARILKPFHSRRYLCVKLCKDTKEKTVLIHRLVAKAFIPVPERFIEVGLTSNDLEVNHIDGNPANNDVTNLEWCTKQENMDHAKQNHLMPPGKKGGAHKRAHKVAMYDLEGNLLKIFDALSDVAYFFTGERKKVSHISQVCQGKRLTAFCHIFRYVSDIEAVETKLSELELSKNSLVQIKRKEYDTFRSAGQSLNKD